jgi:hypothetical protein
METRKREERQERRKEKWKETNANGNIGNRSM